MRLSSVYSTIAIHAAFLLIIAQAGVGSDPSICNCQGYRCGTQNRAAKVVGGRQTDDHQFPWLVSLNYRGKLYCGASLVNDRFLITAAHCIWRVNKARVEIVLGNHNKTDVSEASRIKRTVKDWWAHERFDRRTFSNNIGIIELNEPVEFDRNVRPVCLPTEDRDYTEEYATVPGWGRLSEDGESSDVVRSIRVPIMSNEECKKKKYQPEEIFDNMMCAGFDAGKIDACQGDSGGPLLLERKGFQMDLIGISSWGQGCARSGYPGIYTRIQSFRDFIDPKIASGCSCPQ